MTVGSCSHSRCRSPTRRGADERRTVPSLLRTAPVQAPGSKIPSHKNARSRGLYLSPGWQMPCIWRHLTCSSCFFRWLFPPVQKKILGKNYRGTCSHSRCRSPTRRGADGRRTVPSLLRTAPVQVPIVLRSLLQSKSSFATQKKGAHRSFFGAEGGT